MGILIFGFLTAVLGVSAFKLRSRFVLFLLQVLPFFFLFGVLWINKGSYEILQVKKNGYSFEKVNEDYKQPARSVTIGGDENRDDLLAEALPSHALAITPSLHDGSLQLKILAGGVMVQRNGIPLNVVYLQNGDTIQSGKADLLFESRGALTRSITAGANRWDWPQKAWTEKRIKEPSLARSLASQINTLSAIGAALHLPISGNAALGMVPLQLSLSRKPILMNRVFLTGYAPGATVNHQPAPLEFACNDGDVLTFFSLQTDSDPPRFKSAASYILRNNDRLYFFDPTPEVIGAKEELFRNGSALNKPLLISTSTLPYSVFPTAHYSHESARFSGNFAFVQTQQSQGEENLLTEWKNRALELMSLRSPKFEVVTDTGTFRPEDGEQIGLGKTDQILFSIHRVRFPWQILQLALILLVLKSLFQPPFFSAIENRAISILAIQLDFFLATRLLFSFRAASLYPFSAETLPLALFAMLLVPYVVFAAALCARAQWQRSHLIHFLVYTALFCGICGYFFQNYMWLGGSLALIASLVAFFRFHPRSPLPQLLPRLHAMRRWTPEMMLFGFLVLVLALQLMGAGEALEFTGVRMPLAILYHPALLLFGCHYLVEIRQRLQSEQRDLRAAMLSSGKLLLVLGVFLVASFATSDFGFFILYCIPFLFLLLGIGALYVSEYEFSWKGAGALMAVPVLSVMFLFSSYSTIARVLPESYVENRYVQRVLLAAAPDALEESGLIATERQLGHQRTFLAYARSGLLGAGYMNRQISPALAGTALNDNVPSVFLLNDFGALGLIGVTLVLLGWIWLWLQGARNAPGTTGNLPLTFRTTLSLAALVTWVFSDFYMILANCGIVLFTGKNVFLWGLNSASDLIHSSLLFCLIALPLQQVDEPEVLPAVPAEVQK